MKRGEVWTVAGPFTTIAVGAPLMMVDKITTVSKGKLEKRVGSLSPQDVVQLNRAVLVFLGLARSGAK